MIAAGLDLVKHEVYHCSALTKAQGPVTELVPLLA